MVLVCGDLRHGCPFRCLSEKGCTVMTFTHR
jgi:hypothetical protein